MATIRKIWRCTNSQCKNDKGRHRGYKKIHLGEKVAPLCKHCQQPMVLSANYSTRIMKNGRTFSKAVSPRKGDAEAHLAACVVARNSGALFPGEEPMISWEQGKKYFIEWIDNAKISGKTKTYYKDGLKPLNAYFRYMNLQEIEKAHLETFKKDRRKSVAGSTVNNSIAAMKRMYTIVTSEVEGITARNYPRLHEAMTEIFKVKLEKLDNRPDIILETEEEIKVLLAQCKAPHLYHFAFGILNTGLRNADMLKLKTTEVSFTKNEIETKVKGQKVVHIPLTSQYRAYLETWIKGMKLRTVANYLIPSKEDPLKCYKSDSNIGFETACKNAADHFDRLGRKKIAQKFRQLTPHHLRHTFATHYLYKTSKEEGTTIAVFKLSQILGHSSTYITERYSHVISQLDQASMQHFGNQMFGGVK